MVVVRFSAVLLLLLLPPTSTHYFAYLTLYSVGEFGTLTVQAWHPWAIFIAVYFLSLLMLARKALLAEAGADDAAKGSLIAGSARSRSPRACLLASSV